MVPIFSSFIMAGFECTYALGPHKKRFDLLAASKHDQYCREDFQLLKDIGITTVREGLSWSEIDTGKTYDFSRFEKIMRVAEQEGIEIVWDLNHFDYPAYLNPFSNKFIDSFGEYAKQAINKIQKYQKNIYIIPINEISFFAWNGADVGWCAPYTKNKGGEFKKQLVKASINAMNIIWKENLQVRFIHADPLMRRVAKDPKNKKAQEIAHNFKESMYESWDMIGGYKKPELGGHPKYLDILGINYYWINQEFIVGSNRLNQTSYQTMPWNSKYRVSFATLLNEAYERYHKPMVVTETGSYGALRTRWWRLILKEVAEAADRGLPIHGICSYPTLDRPEWVGLFEPQSGLWDFDMEDKTLKRIPHRDSLQTIGRFLKRWGKTTKVNSPDVHGSTNLKPLLPELLYYTR